LESKNKPRSGQLVLLLDVVSRFAFSLQAAISAYLQSGTLNWVLTTLSDVRLLFELPLLDELRTYCYENKIEGIPAFLSRQGKLGKGGCE
jgi:hypothetical protein